MKNPVLIDHFLHPRRMGDMADPPYQSTVKSDTCADIVRMMALIDEKGVVADIRTKVYGCGYSIAGASFFNELASGAPADEIAAMSETALLDLVGSIPDNHHGCVSLALRAFKKIYRDYAER